MPKYTVEARLTHTVTMIIEADNDDLAEEIAYEARDEEWEIVDSDFEINDITEKQ